MWRLRCSLCPAFPAASLLHAAPVVVGVGRPALRCVCRTNVNLAAWSCAPVGRCPLPCVTCVSLPCGFLFRGPWLRCVRAGCACRRVRARMRMPARGVLACLPAPALLSCVALCLRGLPVPWACPCARLVRARCCALLGPSGPPLPLSFFRLGTQRVRWCGSRLRERP